MYDLLSSTIVMVEGWRFDFTLHFSLILFYSVPFVQLSTMIFFIFPVFSTSSHDFVGFSLLFFCTFAVQILFIWLMLFSSHKCPNQPNYLLSICSIIDFISNSFLIAMFLILSILGIPFFLLRYFITMAYILLMFSPTFTYTLIEQCIYRFSFLSSFFVEDSCILLPPSQFFIVLLPFTWAI